ncbi:CBS domain-containing protein [Inquilinus sp. OTU3971]|uniref:CBS domain-containing protein n=1 Tax=Inquilinus sp. OTU3971 TaxID=3043855 RepID=UPI00313ED519
MKVKDAMHNGAACVEATTSLREVARRMRDDDIGAIPVRADGQLIGIVTDRDITCRALADSGDPAKLTVREVMTKNVTCCSSDDDIATAIKVMEERKVRRLPVMDSNKNLIGMLSLGDLSHKVAKDLSGQVLSAVSAHHR